MKFAHLADCHIGGWREPELRKLGIESFKKAVEICISRHVGFVLIAGDLFNSALPDISLLKETASILRELRRKNISVYVIAGSHDFSAAGKTMIDVLEKAGLVHNVVRFNQEGKLRFSSDKTGVKIAGFLGKKGGLEIEDYKGLELEEADGFKIFMFHTMLEEFKPKELEKVEGLNVAMLPEGFKYYAGGHVHYIFEGSYSLGKLAYSGALFPNNFKELEEFKHGSFYVVDDGLNIEKIEVKLKDVLSFSFNADSKDVDVLEREIKDELRKHLIKDKILTLRIAGVLKSGKPSDVNFKELFKEFKDAYCILKNVSKLSSKEFEDLAKELKEGSVEEVEEVLIKENLRGVDLFDEEKVAKELISVLDIEKEEGEKVIDFDNRIIKSVLKVFGGWDDT